MNLQTVILSGGSGSRLWPLSRESYPKQILPLIENCSLIQECATRAAEIGKHRGPLIICNEEHRFLIASQMQEINIKPTRLLLEPVGKNTAPAIALAAMYTAEVNPDATMVVFPADHHLPDIAKLNKSLEAAVVLANQDFIVTLGINPTKAATGYGYIHRAEAIGDGYKVDNFYEKPTVSKAEEYVKSSEFYWNAGIFVFKPKVILQALAEHAKDIYSAVKNIYAQKENDLDFTRFPKEVFQSCRSDSIDYAVMEKAENVVVVPLDATWSDLGTWEALHEAGIQDEDGNVCTGDVLAIDVKNSYLRSDGRMVVAIGVQNLAIVETSDALLVADIKASQEIKKVVEHIKTQGRTEHSIHRKVYRPWGVYESLISGDRFQVKKITVNPGCKLSLQKHFNRAEHWVVVDGTAKVTRDNDEIILSENESIYIPVGSTHRVENPGKIPLHLIEVQSGSYLGEDDIIRVEDDYGRIPSK